jgi:hypothetical protein
VTGLGGFLTIGFLWQLFENYRNSQIFNTLFYRKRYVLIGLGHILGDCFTNSSGHPAHRGARRENK